MEENRQAYTPSGSKVERPANHGKPWSAEERHQVAEQYGGGIPIPQIAKNVERSEWAVAIKLYEAGFLGKDELRRLASPAAYGRYMETQSLDSDDIRHIQEEVDVGKLLKTARSNANAA